MKNGIEKNDVLLCFIITLSMTDRSNFHNISAVVHVPMSTDEFFSQHFSFKVTKRDWKLNHSILRNLAQTKLGGIFFSLWKKKWEKKNSEIINGRVSEVCSLTLVCTELLNFERSLVLGVRQWRHRPRQGDPSRVASYL